MTHFEPYRKRIILGLPLAEGDGWRLKRYAIVADHRTPDPSGIASASAAAFGRLPEAGTLIDGGGNHGVGFQIFHFAEQIPLVSPVFYWKWGSVLSNIHQMRSYSTDPYEIVDGHDDVVGCVWELEIVAFEVRAWRDTMLGEDGDHDLGVQRYLSAMRPE